MLANVEGTDLTVVCNICDTETIHNISNITLKYIEDVGEYENLMLECPNCHAVEGFNMNLSENDETPLSEMPPHERIQRHHVRRVINIINKEDIPH